MVFLRHLAVTPCCGPIRYLTGWTQLDQAIDQVRASWNQVDQAQALLDQGICPYCQHPFTDWLQAGNGFRVHDRFWAWDHDRAYRAWRERQNRSTQ